jgi:lipoprotein-anchoring transpeptidase ErfK/SrfK
MIGMDDADLQRRLSEAFDAQARASVREDALAPPPRFASAPVRQQHHWPRLLAPLAAAVVVAALAVSMVVFRGHSTNSHSSQPHRPVAARPAAVVHVKVAGHDGASYGVGMPVVTYFSRKFGSAKAFSAATSVTVNGKPMHGAWYFEPSALKGYPIEGHLRLPTYWPAHATVRVVVDSRGLPAGTGTSFAENLQLQFRTGPRTVAVVDDAKHRMMVTQDGKYMGSYPVSLGAGTSPTMRGVKVIMAKLPTVCLRGRGFAECGVHYAQKLTYDGEYLHSAPWNTANVTRGVDTSNGCTNLLPRDAALLYKQLQVGDVVTYPDANGPAMQADAGYGDWNVPWSTWVRGGLIPS